MIRFRLGGYNVVDGVGERNVWVGVEVEVEKCGTITVQAPLAGSEKEDV